MTATGSKSPLWLWGLIALSVLGVGGIVVILVLGAVAFSDTGKTLADFPSQDSARAFVSAHLPAELPAAVRVSELRYDRFTDWYLEARLAFPSPTQATDYLRQTRQSATLDEEYCGVFQEEGSETAAAFFMADTYACGTLRLTDAPGELSVVTATR